LEDLPEIVEEKKVVEIPKMTIYNCELCTLENPISNTRCGICDSARPNL
jgi:predicted RNA-binding protein with PUA domain